MSRTVRVKTLLQSPDTPESLKNRLLAVSAIRDFASQTLHLPDNNSYRVYADIGRKYIVWNVFATPPLSLEPHRSCFVMVGCLAYRGYFNRADALDYMQQLQEAGLDVYLGGVTAYSTLGWFDDPVLAGMLERSDPELARLVFHELAHQQLYIRDDTEFNEAYADAVALLGVEHWLDAHADADLVADFRAQLAREEQFTELVLGYQDSLRRLFQSGLEDDEKLAQKALLYSQLRRDYQALRASWGDHDEYDAWFASELNNAKLAAVSTYRKLLPLFFASYSALDRDLQAFYRHVEQLSRCPKDKRRSLLREDPGGSAC